jgi:hypothetical protein
MKSSGFPRIGLTGLVAGGALVACANGALPERGVNDPRSPGAPEAPMAASAISPPASSSSAPAPVHHHTTP